MAEDRTQRDVVTDGDLTIRRLRDVEEDYHLLARWLSDPRVLEWYRGRDRPQDYDGIVSKYRPRALADHPVRSCIIQCDGRSVGYIQYYPVEAYEEMSKWFDDPVGAWAMDFFLGEPDLWGRGLGSRAIALLKDYLFETVVAARVASDPRVVNARSIAACEKAGFVRGRGLPDHETHEGETWDCVLMEATP